jgi:hypothetical protein
MDNLKGGTLVITLELQAVPEALDGGYILRGANGMTVGSWSPGYNAMIDEKRMAIQMVEQLSDEGRKLWESEKKDEN